MSFVSRPLIVAALSICFLASSSVFAGILDFLSNGDVKSAYPSESGATTATATSKQSGKEVAKEATGGNKCVDQLMKTRTMTAREIMTEVRNLKGGFTTTNPVASLNRLFLGVQPVKTAASPPVEKSKPAKGAPQQAGNRTNSGKPGNDCGLVSAEGLAVLNSLSGGGNGRGSMFGSITSSLSDVLLDALVADLSYTAIDGFLAQMLETPDVMANITVEIPDVASLSPELRKQTLSLGGYLAAIKGSNLMVESAQKEFENAKESYKKVMGYREKAAATLREAILAKQELKAALAIQKAKGVNWISAADIEYVTELQEKNPEDFFRDYRVQQVAIAYLRSQPNRKGDILELESAQTEFRQHYGAYARTTLGVGSMVGFSSLFLKKTKSLWEKQGLAGGVVLVPMITQAVKEVGTLSMSVSKVFEASDGMNEGSFRISKGGAVDKAGISFQRAVSRLDDGAVASLRNDLIRDDGTGYVTLLYQRAKPNAANLADRIAGKVERRQVADAFGLNDPDLFTFQNALGDKTGVDARKRKELVKMFLSNVRGSDDDDVALAAVQRQLREHVDQYTNGDARRLMFARAGSTGEQWLPVGEYRIEIDNLGMEGLQDHLDFLIAESRHATTRTLEKSDGGKGKRSVQ